MSSYDIDNEELFPLYRSSSLKVCISSDSETEEEESINYDDTESIDSEMMVRLSSSVCNLCQKRQIHINNDFTVTVWMLCVIPHILKDAKDHSDSDHSK